MCWVGSYSFLFVVIVVATEAKYVGQRLEIAARLSVAEVRRAVPKRALVIERVPIAEYLVTAVFTLRHLFILMLSARRAVRPFGAKRRCGSQVSAGVARATTTIAIRPRP